MPLVNFDDGEDCEEDESGPNCDPFRRRPFVPHVDQTLNIKKASFSTRDFQNASKQFALDYGKQPYTFDPEMTTATATSYRYTQSTLRRDAFIPNLIGRGAFSVAGQTLSSSSYIRAADDLLGPYGQRAGSVLQNVRRARIAPTSTTTRAAEEVADIEMQALGEVAGPSSNIGGSRAYLFERTKIRPDSVFEAASSRAKGKAPAVAKEAEMSSKMRGKQKMKFDKAGGSRDPLPSDYTLKKRPTTFQFSEDVAPSRRALADEPFNQALYDQLKNPARSMQGIRNHLANKANLRVPETIEMTELRSQAQTSLEKLGPLQTVVDDAKAAKAAAGVQMQSLRTTYNIAAKNLEFKTLEYEEAAAVQSAAKEMSGGVTGEARDVMLDAANKKAIARTEYNAAKKLFNQKKVAFQTAQDELKAAQTEFQKSTGALEKAKQALATARSAVSNKSASVADALKALRSVISTSQEMKTQAVEAGTELAEARVAAGEAAQAEATTTAQDLRILRAKPQPMKVLDPRFKFTMSRVSDTARDLGRTMRTAIGRIMFRQMGVAESSLEMGNTAGEVGTTLFESVPNDLRVIEESGALETRGTVIVEKTLSRQAMRYAFVGTELAAEVGASPALTAGYTNLYADVAMSIPMAWDAVQLLTGYGVPKDYGESYVPTQVTYATPKLGAWRLTAQQIAELKTTLQASGSQSSLDQITMIDRQLKAGLPIYSVVFQRDTVQSPSADAPIATPNTILHQGSDFPTISARIVGRLSKAELTSMAAGLKLDTDLLRGQSPAMLQALGMNAEFSTKNYTAGMEFFYTEAVGAERSQLTDAQRAQLESTAGSQIMPVGSEQDPVEYVTDVPTAEEINSMATTAFSAATKYSLLSDIKASQDQINQLPAGSLRDFKQASLDLIRYNEGLITERPTIPDVPYTAQSIAAFNQYAQQETTYDDRLQELQTQIAQYALVSTQEEHYDSVAAALENQIQSLKTQLAEDENTSADAVKILQDAVAAQELLLQDAQSRYDTAQSIKIGAARTQSGANTALENARNTFTTETSEFEQSYSVYADAQKAYERATFNENQDNVYAAWLYEQASNARLEAQTSADKALQKYNAAKETQETLDRETLTAQNKLREAQLSNSLAFQDMMVGLNRQYGADYSAYNQGLQDAIVQYATTYDDQVENLNEQIRQNNLGLEMLPYFDQRNAYRTFSKRYSPLSGTLDPTATQFNINSDQTIGAPGQTNGPPLGRTALAYAAFYTTYAPDAALAKRYNDLATLVANGQPPSSFNTLYGTGSNGAVPVPTYTREDQFNIIAAGPGASQPDTPDDDDDLSMEAEDSVPQEEEDETVAPPVQTPATSPDQPPATTPDQPPATTTPDQPQVETPGDGPPPPV